MKPAVGQNRPIKIYKPVNNSTNVKSRLSPQKGHAVGGIDPARLSLPANPGANNRFQGGERRGGGRVGPNRRSLNNSLNSGNSNNVIKRVGAGGGMGNKGGSFYLISLFYIYLMLIWHDI